jgi:SAM-dependent methyltransferase
MRLFDRLRRLAPGVLSREPPLSVAHDGFEAWRAWRAARSDRLDAQYRLQCEIGAALGADGWPGWCGLCSRPVSFLLPSVMRDPDAELRATLDCPNCRLNARGRAALSQLVQGLALESAQVYLTEQASAAFVWLQQKNPGVQGSEFALTEASRKRLQAGFEALGGTGPLVERDVTRLDFADASLDAIGCFDVLEHVPDYPVALRGFSRCLRPGGRLVLTVPFRQDSADTLVRARLRPDGSVEHLLEPEIHGDPVAGGVLCYYHFGWDLLDACRAAGFRRASWVRTWSPREAMFGLWTLVAIR